MTDSNPPVRSIADTALWVAYYRARETERPDAVFRDPYARRLAGERGIRIANTLPEGNKHEWGWVARTFLFDQFILNEIQHGADVVLNLAAGLDARPYRMDLAPNLRWVEVDLPEILSYKGEILANEKPHCRLERIPLDLSDISARSKFFSEIDRQAAKALTITEGLLLYFTAEEVGSLADDLAVGKNFRSWIVDLVSPGQLKRMQRTTGKKLNEVGAEFKFAPPEGTDFFLPHGWTPVEVQALVKTAEKLNRLPTELRPFLAEPRPPFGSFPWSGVCLLKRS